MSELPPGPRLPGTIQTLAYGLRPLAYFDAMRRRFGPTFTIRFYDGEPIVVCTEPDDLRALFALGPDEFDAGVGNVDVLEAFLGPTSLLVLDGDAHRAERRRMQRVFHGAELNQLRAVMRAVAARHLTSWPIGQEFALHPRLQSLTLDVILAALFGPHAGADLHPLRRALSTFLTGASGSPFVLIPPFRRTLGGMSPWARFVRERDAVRRELLRLLDARPGEGMVASLQADPGVPNAQVLDEVMTLVLAGHDTTATALAWTFDLLLHHPVALERLRTSLARGEHGLLDAVVHESLRVRPVIADVVRGLRRPLALSVGVLPAGTTVMAAIHLAHTDARRYPEPNAFRPERFLGTKPDLATWLPFGGGVRRCLGAGFATAELHEVLSAVVTRVSMRPVKLGMEHPKRRAVTLMPRDGVPVVVDSISAEMRRDPLEQASA